MFTVSPAAATRILDSAEQSGANGMAVRIAAKIDDEGQVVFGLGFDEKREHDDAFECEGLTVVIAPPSQDILSGMMLDFVEIEPGDWQFAFFQTEAPGGCSSDGGGSGGSGGCGGCGSRSGCSSGG